MKKLKNEQKKNIMRVLMIVMAALMILGFVLLPIAETVGAEEDNTAVSVDSFETGKLGEAIEKAKDGTDLNNIEKIAVSGGVMNSADYSALCGYPNVQYIELAGCETENGVIPDNALQSRNQLLYISLPKNTETIGSRAFSGNRTLLKVSIPSTLRKIGDYAFEGCEKVEEFSVPAELETIGTGAFSDCKSLKSFALPEAITEIPEYCFSKCSFTEMHFGPQITTIGNGAFSDCHSLTDIYFYGTQAPAASESAFQNLKVTIHTYKDGDGFDSLDSNFVDIAYDLSSDSVYIPPKSAETSNVPESDGDVSDTEAQTSAETESEDSEDISEQVTTAASEASASEALTEAAAPASAPASFSGISVAVIAVLCVAVGVMGALLAVKSKKK